MIIYRSTTKGQLASDADVSPNIMRQWINESYDDLKKFNVKKTAKKLPPAAVKYLSEKYGIMPSNATVT